MCLRRIMRRACATPPCSSAGIRYVALVPALVHQMGTAYPSCARAASDLGDLRFEETNFQQMARTRAGGASSMDG